MVGTAGCGVSLPAACCGAMREVGRAVIRNMVRGIFSGNNPPLQPQAEGDEVCSGPEWKR